MYINLFFILLLSLFLNVVTPLSIAPSHQPSSHPSTQPTSEPSSVLYTTPSFDLAKLYINSGSIKVAFDFNITFRLTRDITSSEIIVIKLPRFTESMAFSGNNTALRTIPFGDFLVAPSYIFSARWIPGTLNSYNNQEQLPYEDAELHIKLLNSATLLAGDMYLIQVFQENNIGSFCGFPSSMQYSKLGNNIVPFKPFKIMTATLKDSNDNIRYYNNDSYPVDSYPAIGQGCSALNTCNLKGQCDYCYNKCYCFSGFGSNSDLVTIGRDLQADCSSRVCPSGKAIADLPTTINKAHAIAECSNRGTCDRKTGLCNCYPPFTGSACEKMNCPNDCSGHGQCLNMADITKLQAYNLPGQVKYEYGSAGAIENKAWDYDVMYGCICDSSWEVGFNMGETQLAEYFGADCSLKRCPSGDDPWTTVDETDCSYKNQVSPGRIDIQRGRKGNKCHIECSNRGKCDYSKGSCTCFENSWGIACEHIANAGKHSLIYGADTEYFWKANGNNSIIVEGN